MKKLTSLSILNTGEGDRIAFTYSEVSETGEIIAQNKKGNFLIMNEELREHANAIRNYINEQYME